MRKTHRLIEQHLINGQNFRSKKLLKTRKEILKPLRVVRKSLNKINVRI